MAHHTATAAGLAGSNATTTLWTEKYRPRSVAQMCYPASANKLLAWMECFVPYTPPVAAGKKRQRAADEDGSGSDSDDGGSAAFKKAVKGTGGGPRAALLSGPPGIGKTTAVYLVAQELGRTVIEYNASDFRSKKSLREHVSDVINNRVFQRVGVAAGGHLPYAEIVLLMDEVDGCDLGGVGQVIDMIKTTTVPIVCTCNDRWHPKLRSLLNHVEDIRVTRPPCNIVANWICERVLAREGVSLSKQLLQDIIKSSGSDIRSMLNNLQVWCMQRRAPPGPAAAAAAATAPGIGGSSIRSPGDNVLMQLNQRELATCALQSQKNKDVGLFEAAEAFLLQGTSGGERKSIQDLQGIYYSSDLVDLFVQENYLHFNPERCESEAPSIGSATSATAAAVAKFTASRRESWMDAVATAAHSISAADMLQRIMYTEQNWSVSTSYVLLSSIIPCAVTRGKYESFMKGQQVFIDRQRPVKFPSWLGNNSTAGKNQRLLRCLAMQAASPSPLPKSSSASSSPPGEKQGGVVSWGISGTAADVMTDYIPLGFERPLTVPLAATGKDGIPEVIDFMDRYHILRDDWDFVQDMAHFKKMVRRNPNPIALSSVGSSSPIATAVKSAFTREFNKTHRLDALAKVAMPRAAPGSSGGPSSPTGAGYEGELGDDDQATVEEDDGRAAEKLRRQAEAAAAASAAKAAKAKAKTSPASPRAKRAPAKQSKKASPKAAAAKAKPSTRSATKRPRDAESSESSAIDSSSSDSA